MTRDRDPPLEAKTLGELLLIQGTVALLPHTRSILQFICHGLGSVPGVDRVEFRIGSGPWERAAGFTRVFALRSGGHDHGGLRVHCEDPTLFLPYAPYIENLAAMLGVVLEERRQRELNASHQRELEAGVEESAAHNEPVYEAVRKRARSPRPS